MINVEERLEDFLKVQNRISKMIILEDRFYRPIRTVTGFDVAYSNGDAVAASVTMDFKSHRVLEERAERVKTVFPYIPTLLSFREGPIIMRMFRRLRLKPDVLLVNSHGLAHPRLCGCASYIGVLLNKPTIGVARSRLCGVHEEPERVGEWRPLRYGGRMVGAALLSKKGCRPIFISPGHLITLETAIKVVKSLIEGHKMPEPLLRAHRLAEETKRLRLTGH